MNWKILLAPILAVALVLSLAATANYLPISPQASTQNQASPQPSPAYYLNITTPVPSPTANFGTESGNAETPAPTTVPAPTAAPAVIAAPTATTMTGLASHGSDEFFVLSIFAAIVIGVVAALLLFSERNFKKELARDAQT